MYSGLPTPGDRLEKLCRAAKSELLLVAPFVKVSVLRRLLRSVSPGVLLRCVTRWRPDEIAVGVSDIEVWPLLSEYFGSSLWLRPDLHAKYYRADESCLVGSANLTAAALGWAPHSNLELLVPIGCSSTDLRGFEEYLMSGCVQVSADLYQYMAQVVDEFKEKQPDRITFVEELPQTPAYVPGETPELPVGRSRAAKEWLPTLRYPEKLYDAHSGRLDELTEANKTAALQDLTALDVPAGLARPAFEAYVAAILLQKPVIQAVDDFVKVPQRFGAVRDLLATLPCAEVDGFEANRAWQTLMRWLLFFLPNRYKLAQPAHSEVVVRTTPVDGI